MRNKIVNKRGNVVTDSPIILIIGLLAVIMVILFLFNGPLLRWVKNLPGFESSETDEVVDSTGESGTVVTGAVCGDGTVIGKIVNNYIYLSEGRSVFYWEGEEREAKIKVSDFIVGIVSDGKISINKDYLDFDSIAFQKIRFVDGVNISDFAKIDGAHYFGSNQLCKSSKDSFVDYGILREKELIKISLAVGASTGKIDLTPYLVIQKDSPIEYFYLVDKGDYLEIRGKTSWWRIESTDLGRIYPDGSVWFSMSLKNIKVSEELIFKSRDNIYPSGAESNLVMEGYDSIKSHL